MTDHEIRLLFLPWVQAHYIQRYADKTVVSHNEGVEELLEILRPELDRLRRIETAARAYVNSDPPRPEWRELAHALGDADNMPQVPMPLARSMYAALCRGTQNEETQQAIAAYEQWTFHPIAGKLQPQAQPCSSYMPDGRSEICARCDWPEDAHGSRAD